MASEAAMSSGVSRQAQHIGHQSVAMDTDERIPGNGDDGSTLLNEDKQQEQPTQAPNRDEENNASEQEQQQDAIPPPKFDAPLARVYARDESGSGILYKAVIRRKLYGTAPPKQIKILPGEPVTNVVQEPTPTWHYFVHYLGWNVKWDRWVDQDSLFEITEETTRLAQQLEYEIKQAKKKTRDKQKVMLEFKKRMQELSKKNEDGTVDSTQETRQQKVNFAREKELYRSSQLTSRNNSNHEYNIVLPFALKKIMVEEWEIVTQCNMVHKLPAEMSVYQALQEYLKVKLSNYKQKSAKVPQDSAQTQDSSEKTTAPQKDAAQTIASTEKRVAVQKVSKQTQDSSEKQTAMQNETCDETQAKITEWTDMVDGICLLFDQALAFRLLYSQEKEQQHDFDYFAAASSVQGAATAAGGGESANEADPASLAPTQYNDASNDWAKESAPADNVASKDMAQKEAAPVYNAALKEDTDATKSSTEAIANTASKEIEPLRPCQVYGCEFLLRLLVQLPQLMEMLVLSSRKEVRPILSKLHDLVRYLQKHQATLFTQRYQKRIGKPSQPRSRKRKAVESTSGATH